LTLLLGLVLQDDGATNEHNGDDGNGQGCPMRPAVFRHITLSRSAPPLQSLLSWG
jgi:hypothetical protein